MQPSPYTPGEIARDLPGRAVQLSQLDERLSYLIDLRRLVGRIRVDTGTRGIGKTSLLREMQRRAQARGALTIWVTAGGEPGLIASLADEIERRTADWKGAARRTLRANLKRLTVTLGVPNVAEVQAELARREATQGVREFEDVVRHTVDAALHAKRSGLVLFVDELQAADDDGLRTLATAWQHLQSEGPDVRAAVFAAGLPRTPERVAFAVTFAERFAFRPLDRLDADAAALALVTPARAAGVEWDERALTAACELADGYPYLLQLIGDATWVAAGHPHGGAVLASAHVRAGRKAIKADMDALFRARWEKVGQGERDFLRAMADIGDGPARRADIASALGVDSRDVSVPRARLIDKGVIEPAGRGVLQFCIPGFAAYVREHAPGSR